MQISTVQPVFKLELNHKVTPGIVIIAKYDGTHPCLTASAGYDKIIIHHPHNASISGRVQRSQAHGEVSELNLSQGVVALAAGPLKPDCPRDILLIGSPSQVLAYDVHENADLFYKDTPDGVNEMTSGYFAKHNDCLCIVGGNSSVQGLNWEGDEIFWNVVSGKVSSMLLLDFDKDGENELLIGCDDFYIRVLKNNQFMTELSETGSIINLSVISEPRFAYALSNGTIGIYEEGIRLWRVKSKQNAVSLHWSGETLACCWMNGRIDWREGSSGRVLRRVQMRSDAAAMLTSDYRSVGAPDIVCVSVKGEVLGYSPYQENAASFDTNKSTNSEKDRLLITELFSKKQALMLELQHYESNISSSAGAYSIESVERSTTAMPANTKIQVAVSAALDEGCLELVVMTNNETIVRAALILAEGVFESGETLASHPDSSQLRSRLYINLRPPRDVPVDVHIKALVGYPDSEQYHIFELTKQLPRFAMYTLLPPPTVPQSKQLSYVTFQITERVQRICLWINQNFLLEEELQMQSEDTKDLHVTFTCLRNKSRLDIDFESDGQVKFSTTDIKLAGDLIQSLAIYLNLIDLKSTAQFPEAEQKIREEMGHLGHVSDVRSHLAAETAERAQLITALLPAAQDAASYDLKEMQSRYKEVVLLNEELLAGSHARRAAHQHAVDSLKSLHSTLQQAARLRVGAHAKAVVASCREAVKANDVEAIIKVLQVGHS